jgi:hypothetical protein
VTSLYAASTREAAAFESIFHDILATARFKTIRLEAVESRSISEIAPRRDLALAQLFTPDLKAWGVPRNRLIDTPKSAYGKTVRWAEALHAAHGHVDGMVWTSKQCDPEICMLLFGDRSGESDFDVLESRGVADGPALLLEIRGFGARAGITIVS